MFNYKLLLKIIPIFSFARDKGDFKQLLDHNDVDKGHWYQKFVVSEKYYIKENDNSPVFLLIRRDLLANEFDEDRTWIHYAAKHKALCFSLEHRYFGKSQPFKTASVKNMKYLSTEQAIGDIAYFIDRMNKKYKLKATNKWILFGYSYTASLAAWARLKHPEFVYAAVASGGSYDHSIYAPEYIRNVKKIILQDSGIDCVNAIMAGSKEIEDLLKSTSGKYKIKQLFRLTSAPNTNDEVGLLFLVIVAGFFQAINRNNLEEEKGIKEVCEKMTDPNNGSTFAERFTALLPGFKEGSSEEDMSFESYIEGLKISINNPGKSTTWPWKYLNCKEFGHFQTTEPNDCLFGHHLLNSFYHNMCKDAFGIREDETREGVMKTNSVYGGKSIKDKVTRVAFVHGSYDPWNSFGILESNNPASPAIFIERMSHCYDSYIPEPGNLQTVIDGVNKIGTIINKWINEPVGN